MYILDKNNYLNVQWHENYLWMYRRKSQISVQHERPICESSDSELRILQYLTRKEWSSFRFIGSLLEMQTLRLHPRPTGLELHFNKISGWFVCTLKFEMPCSITLKTFNVSVFMYVSVQDTYTRTTPSLKIIVYKRCRFICQYIAALSL